MSNVNPQLLAAKHTWPVIIGITFCTINTSLNFDVDSVVVVVVAVIVLIFIHIRQLWLIFVCVCICLFACVYIAVCMFVILVYRPNINTARVNIKP